MNLKTDQCDDLDRKGFCEDGGAPWRPQRGTPSWTELRKEREGLKCRALQRSEVREEGLGNGISHRDSGSQTSAQHTQGCGGVPPALGGPPEKGSMRDRVSVSMCVIYGERKLQNLSFLCLV